MTKEEALNTLMKMRAWRAWGKEQKEEERPEMPEQKEVDEAFDICIEMLSNPTLPSDMATAAIHAAQNDMCDRQIMEDSYEHRMLYSRVFRRGFKDGVEWLAGQGVSVEGKVIMDFSDPDDIINRRLIAKLGDALLKVEPGDVIIQIREK